MEYFGPNGDMYLATKKLKRIAIVLKPQESPAEFEIHFKRPDADEIMIKTEKDAELPHNAAIFHSAKTLVESVRVNDNPKKKRLVEDYTHINDQISTNETAIQDTLAYVNLTADIDKAGTTEHLNQIKELTVSINKEKRRRDSVLAAMIAHDWVGKREELDDLLQSDIQIQTPSTSHEQLMAMYDKLKQKGDQVAVLQSKLQNQLSWVSAEDTSRDDTFQELEKLADQLKDELDVLSVLENQRQSVCVGFLRSNKGVHKMLVELL
ncbi:hypothetical protein BBO99_00006894 [Phytophthora kernoviae]|uniref:Uncharacterized protein n=2 Tax=Phytophthora kernoviae TaxID=325452 RepID=A0A3R7KRX5_9STRA|nr:hypothetical protein G195_005487 [Phytophthora kernoviae 00238/432]KAG2520919.1 hypothetical protein JM16_006534 [Phytophthora kernoviae]KAG2521934.1 hypothetical protein JM18_006348 [Phytophthora kernoviae]RLN32042.1 hypothetical protein BBI17_006916 [Phytophthora kernoviae]RLN77251.1 hypothetical protein BBO99_00006894 [Phytophthora kernoviae]